MRKKQPPSPKHRHTPWLLVACICILFTGALLSFWKFSQVEQQMKTALLQQAQLTASAIDVKNLEALSGTEADLSKPEYQRIKSQLKALQQNTPGSRFIYLMGRNTTGQVFFFVDSEPAESPDCSPAGQLYQEASGGVLRAFSKHQENVEGPYTDRWGTWISAFVPITDQRYSLANLASTAEAKALVRQAVSFKEARGKDALLAELSDPEGQFHNGDLYAFAYDLDMTMLAHPITPELIGQSLIDKKDWEGGKHIRREIQEVVLNEGNGWVDYEYENPANKQIEPKTSYVQISGDIIVCAGAYKGGGAILGVLGSDVQAFHWYWKIARKSSPPLILTLLLILLTILTMKLIRQRGTQSGEHPVWMAYIEQGAVAVAGILLTFFWTWFTNEAEDRERHEAFWQLAVSRTNGIVEVLKKLRDTELEGLSKYLEHDQHLSYQDFTFYADYLISNPAVQAWEWVPAIPARQLPDFENQMRTDAFPEFQVWERTVSNQEVLVSGRDTYFPVAYFTPYSGNERASGFDLGSERTVEMQLKRHSSPGYHLPATLLSWFRILKSSQAC